MINLMCLAEPLTAADLNATFKAARQLREDCYYEEALMIRRDPITYAHRARELREGNHLNPKSNATSNATAKIRNNTTQHEPQQIQGFRVHNNTRQHQKIPLF